MALVDSRPTSRSRRALDPRLVAAGGSVCIAFSPIFIALADVTPGTATFFRCVLALPVLLPLAWWERRRMARSRALSPSEAGRRQRPLLLLGAGVLLGLDMTLWAVSISAVGAGVSTVLVNAQVVVLPLLAFLVLGERVRMSFVLAVPVMLAGIALAGGLLGGGGDVAVAPVRGTVTALLAAVAYAGYLLLVRLGAGPGEKFGPVGIATIGATASSAVLGGLWQGVDLAPGWQALGWLLLLAIVSQVVGWVLIASALQVLPSSTGASTLLLQPVGAVLLGIAILSQVPSSLQLVGCVVVIGTVAAVSRSWAGSSRGTGEETESSTDEAHGLVPGSAPPVR